MSSERRDSRPAFLYFLADARTPRNPRYLGCTTNPASRERSHRKRGYYGGQALQAWKESVWDAGSDIVFVLFAQYPTLRAALQAEWRLIIRWQRRGLCHCNSWTSTSHFVFAAECEGRHRKRRIA